jgi:hypothetical protein
MWRSVIMSSLIVTLLSLGAVRDSSHAAIHSSSNQNFFVMFFVPGSAVISPEARWIVERAAASAIGQEASAVEIAISSDTARRTDLFEARAAAIEGVLSADGAEQVRFVRRPLSESENRILGAEDRAEIRIVQR